MTEWIKCSDRLPRIPETVLVTDGHRIERAYIWDYPQVGVYFEYEEEKDDRPLIAIWWRPLKDSAIQKAFEENTLKPMPLRQPQENK